MATTEERLAALEAKLAQLTATTPTTYYTHQYSGEEIDAATGRALTGGALDTSVTNVSNQLGTFTRPNLLDNWYFGNPVNQRGQTEYKDNWIYSFDRWKISPSATVSVSGGGLSVIADFQQAILSTALILGQKYTMSVLSTDGRLGQLTFTLQQDIAINQGFGFGYFVVFRDVDQYWFRLYGTDEATYLAIKLELGPTQTLAHREGDRWVMNEVPDYGEQLRRCQRYFRRIKPAQYAGFARGCAYNANSVRVMIPFEPMRTSPSLNLNGATGIFATNLGIGDVFGLSFSAVWTTTESVTFDVSKTGAFVDGKEYILRGDSGGYIDISADL